MNRSDSKYFATAVKMDMALLSLLKKKDFEYITVSELCKEACVNRSTFYLHYENLNDLLEETARYILDGFFACFPSESREITDNLQECELSELKFVSDKYLFPYLNYIKENREIFLTAQLHRRSFGFENVYLHLFDRILNPILDRFHYPEEDRKYVMMYYLNGINAVVLEWMKHGCNKPVEEISEIISVCVYGKDHFVG